MRNYSSSGETRDPFRPGRRRGGLAAFRFRKAHRYVRNHLQAIKQYGQSSGSPIVIVAHGNQLDAFSRLNRAAYPDMHERLKALRDAGARSKSAATQHVQEATSPTSSTMCSPSSRLPSSRSPNGRTRVTAICTPIGSAPDARNHQPTPGAALGPKPSEDPGAVTAVVPRTVTSAALPRPRPICPLA